MRQLLVYFVTYFVLVLSACNPKPTITDQATTVFLDSLSRHTFNFFWERADSVTAQVPDRWPSPSFSSIAATGFGITGYLIGAEQGYISREEAANRVLQTISFLSQLPKGDSTAGVSGYRGFYYHFIDMKTGHRFQQVELSTIDTGLLMAGILSAQSYFDHDNATENHIRALADSMYSAVEWDWAMNNEQTMSMGWHPEKGFIDSRWKGYNEAMILYILALGSPTHSIPADTWNAWTSTYQWAEYYGQAHVNFGPLFGHQYSQMYIDFRGVYDAYMKEKGIDYFENSKRATYANRSYCMANPGHYTGYSANVWGLTACDGPGNANKANPNVAFMGYSARGAAQYYTEDDGTIAPTAAGGSIAFTPEISIPALKTMHELYGDKIYRQYGFVDAFNLSTQNVDGSVGWIDKDYLGIDQGPILIQLANYRNDFVWNLMKKNPHIVRGLKKAGFSGGWLD